MKLRKTFNGNVKAVSPVIATIIIVAIAITMSIAVAYWLLGLGSSFTKYEKVEFVSAYADYDAADEEFTVTLNLKNTGSAAATIDPATVFYNGKPAVAYGDDAPTGFTAVTMNPGKTSNQVVSLPAGTTWSSGMTVEIMLQTSAGKQYPKVVVLP